MRERVRFSKFEKLCDILPRVGQHFQLLVFSFCIFGFLFYFLYIYIFYLPTQQICNIMYYDCVET